MHNQNGGRDEVIMPSIIGMWKNQESGIMLVFWGNNEVLTAADSTNPSKRLRYSNWAVSNFVATVLLI